MASEQKIKELAEVVVKLEKIERDKLLRRGLGEESLEQSLTPLLEEVTNKSEFATKYALSTYEGNVDAVKNCLNAIADQFHTQAGRSNPDYIANKAGFLQEVRNQLENMRAHWPSFYVAAIEERGFLKDEGIRKEYEHDLPPRISYRPV